MGQLTGLGLVLVVLAALAGCVGITPASNSAVDLQCIEQSGFNARAAAARATGQTGKIGATAEEIAATNACMKGAKSAAQQSSAPAGFSTPFDAYVHACMFEVDPPGAYVTQKNARGYSLKRGRGATQAGLDAMYACVDRKAAETNGASLEGTAKVAGVQQSVQVHDLGNGRSVETFTYGTPPSSAPRRAPSPRRTPNSRCTGGVLQGGTSYCIGN